MFGCVPVGPITKPVSLSGGSWLQPPLVARTRVARFPASLADACVKSRHAGSRSGLLARADQLSSQALLPYPSRWVTCSTDLRIVGP